MALFARGLLKPLYTRVYFAGDPANETDPVLQSIDEPMRRQTVIAAPAPGDAPPAWRFDIVMQGGLSQLASSVWSLAVFRC